ncbi:unnamed protein product [Ambrosiozyma monospora]|uniref:Unnamed protein product n=1 Tax=Ambrosiozyma monospora TaxID=43982 RepID=A0ACB5TUU6_AMBMO|nr:unnamed protein product [Ambrosiozyma monospora]
MKFSNTLATLAASLALSEAADTTSTSYTGPTATFADGVSSLDGSYGISLVTISAASSTPTTSVPANKKRDETQVVTETAPVQTYTVNDGTQTYTVNGGTSTATETAGAVAETTTSSESTEAATTSSTSEAATTSSTSTEASSTSTSSTSSTEASSTSSSSDSSKQANIPSVCSSSEGAVLVTLKDGILTDSAGRIGSIVANQQFQFDGPPPQAGYIYASGWSFL